MSKGKALSLNMCPKNPQEREEMSRVPYASVVGSLMYAMMCTRPDICFDVGHFSRCQSNPGREHWKAVKRIMRYLKGTMDYCLVYQGQNYVWLDTQMPIGEETMINANPLLVMFSYSINVTPQTRGSVDSSSIRGIHVTIESLNATK